MAHLRVDLNAYKFIHCHGNQYPNQHWNASFWPLPRFFCKRGRRHCISCPKKTQDWLKGEKWSSLVAFSFKTQVHKNQAHVCDEAVFDNRVCKCTSSTLHTTFWLMSPFLSLSVIRLVKYNNMKVSFEGPQMVFGTVLSPPHFYFCSFWVLASPLLMYSYLCSHNNIVKPSK